MMQVLTVIWNGLNTPAGLTIAGSIVAWLLVRLYAKKPDWKNYEGTIIAAIKHSEKAIPDDVENKSLARLNCALQYVIKVYEQVNQTTISNAMSAALREGIQIKHAELEVDGNLK